MTPRGGFSIESTHDLSRTPDQVFAFLADTRNFKAVDPALVEYEPDGRLAAGITGRFVHRRGGLSARTTWRVTEFDEPRRMTVRVDGIGYAMTEEASLEATTAGTRVRFVERVWPTSLGGRLLVALSGGIMRRDLAKRAALLEAALKADQK